MAKLVITGAVLSLGGTDYSAQVEEATLTVEAAEVEVTNMASGGWKEILSGIKSANLSFGLKQDADLSGLDAAMWTKLTDGADLSFALKLQNAAISTTNPEYQGNVKVLNWSPVAGRVGEAFGKSVTFPVTGAITRDTTP